MYHTSRHYAGVYRSQVLSKTFLKEVLLSQELASWTTTRANWFSNSTTSTMQPPCLNWTHAKNKSDEYLPSLIWSWRVSDEDLSWSSSTCLTVQEHLIHWRKREWYGISQTSYCPTNHSQGFDGTNLSWGSSFSSKQNLNTLRVRLSCKTFAMASSY